MKKIPCDEEVLAELGQMDPKQWSKRMRHVRACKGCSDMVKMCLFYMSGPTNPVLSKSDYSRRQEPCPSLGELASLLSGKPREKLLWHLFGCTKCLRAVANHLKGKTLVELFGL